jgi:DNA topoisomerase-1
VAHDVEVDDPRVASVVRRCLGLPGHELFQFVDENGSLRPVSSTDINTYLREASGADFTAKDYRTWAGSVLALAALRRIEAQLEREAEEDALKKAARNNAKTDAKTDAKAGAKSGAKNGTTRAAKAAATSGARTRKGAIHRHLVQTIKDVAQTLRNTPAVCRRCYIHPAVVDAFEQGELHRLGTVRTRRGLKADEALFAQLLRRHARAMRAAARAATRSMARKRTPKSPGGSGRSTHAVRSSRSSGAGGVGGVSNTRRAARALAAP